jgi:hypothetical protein
MSKPLETIEDIVDETNQEQSSKMDVEIEEKYVHPLVVGDYLFVEGSNPQNAKKLRKKMRKKDIKKYFKSRQVKDFQKDAHQALYTHLKEIKMRQARVEPKCVGFFSDTNTLLNNIMTVPPPPLEWDILCVESNVEKYRYDNVHNNVYWCSAQVRDSKHFVMNYQSANKVMQCVKKAETWQQFINLLNIETKVFMITQFPLSEQLSTCLQQPDKHAFSKLSTTEEKLKCVSEYSKKCFDVMDTNRSVVQVDALVSAYDKMTKLALSKDKQYHLLPNISLICVLTDPNKFFYALHSFMRLDYPRDKLELVVVDDTDAEKKIKRFLPEDSRIKIINISKKKKGSDEEANYVTLPLGYKLNTGVKYASNEIIFHFMDTNHYFASKFRSLVKCFVMSDSDALMSTDTGYMKNFGSAEAVSYKDNVPDICNVIYRKNFWKINSFEDKYDDVNVIAYKWLQNREVCVKYLPFLQVSFNAHPSKSSTYRKDDVKLPFSLKDILDEHTKALLALDELA